MSEKDQAKAVSLLTAALRVLTDEHASPEEKSRVAVDINTFLMTSPPEPRP